MKKLLNVALLILLIVSFATSCEFQVSQDLQDSQPSGGSQPSEEIVVPLPVFGESSSSKGLNSMPIEYFENDHYLACAVMTIMPTMTNLQAVEVSLSGDSFKNVALESTIFGFEVKFLPEYSHVNKDGVYLQYSILYEDTTVGFCDYYYNVNTKKFSYRQSVFCTFEGLNDNEILSMEYTDIPIDNVLEPVFKVGQLVTEGESKGMLAEDAYVDSFQLNAMDSSFSPLKKYFYRRAYITFNEVKESSGLYTMYALKQPDNTFTFTSGLVDFESTEGYSEELKTFITEMKSVVNGYQDEDNKDYLINTETERKNANFDMMQKIFPLLYKKGKSIADHHSTIKGYTNYEDFIVDSFKEQSNAISNNIKRRSDNSPNPVIYTYNGTNSKGAATFRSYRNAQTKTAVLGNVFANIKVKEAYTQLGFEDYFGPYDSTTTTQNIADFTAEKFLKACGIENQDYINAFITGENERVKSSNSSEYYTERLKVVL